MGTFLQLNDIPDEEIAGPELAGNVLQQKHGSKVDANKEKNVSGGNRKKSITKEERIRLKEVKKQLREVSLLHNMTEFGSN